MHENMALHLHAVSHAGRVRADNEDSHALHLQAALLAVADGMGGGPAGEVASAMAISICADDLAAELALQHELLQEDLTEDNLLRIEALMRSQVRRANAAIHERAQQDPSCAGMGTTLVMAVIRGADLLVGHAGDSRAYRLRPRAWRLPQGVQYRHEVIRLTRDHNVGEVPRLTRAIGVEPDVVLEMHRHRLMPEDIVMLCSDGLTDMVADARIEQIAHQVLAHRGASATQDDLVALGQALFDEAMRAGGQDNITLVLASRTDHPTESV